MEKMTSALEHRISSLSSKDRPEEAQQSHEQLLTSPSMDSLDGLGSAGVRSPDRQASFHLELDANGAPAESSGQALRESTRAESAPAGISLRAGSFRTSSGHPSSPGFPQAAVPAVDETIVVGPERIYHSLTREGIQRHQATRSALERIDPVGQWRDHRTLLVVWLVASLVTFVAGLQWLQVGMWAGVLGAIGPAFSVCHCCSDRKLPLNLQVTRIFAVVTSALSTFAFVLFAFLLAKLPCPAKQQNRPSCAVFRAALALTGGWHLLHAVISGLVCVRASQILTQVEPLLSRKVLVVQRERVSPV